MTYVLYPERSDQLYLTLETLSENGVRYRVNKEYKNDAPFYFLAQTNFVVEIFCNYEKFCFMKYLIGKKLDDIVHLEKCLKEEVKEPSTVNIPEFMKSEVKNV